MINVLLWVIYGGLVFALNHFKLSFILITYHIVVNLIAMVMCAVDKNRAINSKWRIPEKKLFMISFIGGALGMWIAMAWFRHKTKHVAFMLGIPVIAAIDASVVFYPYLSF